MEAQVARGLGVSAGRTSLILGGDSEWSQRGGTRTHVAAEVDPKGLCVWPGLSSGGPGASPGEFQDVVTCLFRGSQEAGLSVRCAEVAWRALNQPPTPSYENLGTVGVGGDTRDGRISNDAVDVPPPGLGLPFHAGP